ncbi:Uncharacterised protein [Mycolicibacterium fortuitum]|uniref:Uncharacterized protein n=1 Tax=Mycolicibacterium fortuitum TaxID=1766 RepID=A0A378WE84_MYCFO|nr:Uncharacterised protein [Mycolicibacterium fortuitum]
MTAMSMGYIQIGIVAVALLLRLTAVGWLTLLTILASVLSVGLLPAITFGPLIFAGFAAPPTVWPLLIVADILLLVCALTLEDGGDNDSTSPLELLTGYGGGVLSGKLFRYCAIGYLITLPVLVIWTLAA